MTYLILLTSFLYEYWCECKMGQVLSTRLWRRGALAARTKFKTKRLQRSYFTRAPLFRIRRCYATVTRSPTLRLGPENQLITLRQSRSEAARIIDTRFIGRHVSVEQRQLKRSGRT
ncbi:hypothetical protein PYW08_011863 [Mythimna loreyi]|uniref:Uncharacterized protein n=1 Tax=Mythimna loreyi TaxID=667449 RepID=A0ACC2QKM2_9NEOP|nr:hypothetical protein PYW08_011863 [Mythimna loreyi]